MRRVSLPPASRLAPRLSHQDDREVGTGVVCIRAVPRAAGAAAVPRADDRPRLECHTARPPRPRRSIAYQTTSAPCQCAVPPYARPRRSMTARERTFAGVVIEINRSSSGRYSRQHSNAACPPSVARPRPHQPPWSVQPTSTGDSETGPHRRRRRGSSTKTARSVPPRTSPLFRPPSPRASRATCRSRARAREEGAERVFDGR